MKSSLLLAALLVAGLLVYSPVYAQGTAYFWAGGSFEGEVWYDTMVVVPNQWAEIPIYHMGDPDVYIMALYYTLAYKRVILDTLTGGQLFWPLTEWYSKDFVDYNDDIGIWSNPPGYHSLAFLGWARGLNFMDLPLLHCEVPTHIMSFRAHTADNDNLIGQTFLDAFIEGVSPYGNGPSDCLDSTGAGIYPMDLSFACVHFIEGYKYLPGDVNMYVGDWPPAARSGDVTYLVNFFRGLSYSHDCKLDGFWASADINGDCDVIGSDVTKLINYLRGQTQLSYCPNYPPSWFAPADFPEEPPAGWPGCE